MKKIILIRNMKESNWVSCQSIVRNLEQAYQGLKTASILSTLNYDDSENDFEIYQIVEEIIKTSPDEIVFIDHKPHPGRLLTLLNKLNPEYRPTFTFHVFGDFVLDSYAWYKINNVLQNYKVNFIGASQKQQALIDSFIGGVHKTLIIPFPIDKNVFYFDEVERQQTRNELGIQENDFVFLYTGRISLQKNVLELTKAMDTCFTISGESNHFLIAGPFDDLGIPYLAQENSPGIYFQRWMNLKTKNIQKITYLNNLDPERLRKIYNAADCFISLSTHNDEDYGMAPAEAIMCGLQLILTDWGGYSSFNTIDPRGCHLIPVKHQKKRIIPDMPLVQKMIYRFMDDKLPSKERANLSLKAQEKLSIGSVTTQIASRLQEHDVKTFPGFNNHFFKLSTIFKNNPYDPFVGEYGDYSDFYFEVYDAYLKES